MSTKFLTKRKPEIIATGILWTESLTGLVAVRQCPSCNSSGQSSLQAVWSITTQRSTLQTLPTLSSSLKTFCSESSSKKAMDNSSKATMTPDACCTVDTILLVYKSTSGHLVFFYCHRLPHRLPHRLYESFRPNQDDFLITKS